VRNISILLLLLGISKFSYAISFLNNSEESNTSQVKGLKKGRDVTFQKDSVSRKSHAAKKLSNAEFGNELSKRNEVYDSQISKKMDAFYSGPIVIENYHKIRTLDSYNGILRDSLILTQGPSEVVIYADEKGGLLNDSKLRCKGGVFIQRVKIYCDLLVTPDKEFPVKVLIREKVDGSSTLVPDKFYTGEEARFIKQSFASFFGGVMDASKDRTLTLNGEKELVNAKNKIYNGMFAIADNSENELKKEANDVQVAAVVNSGREVRIEFLEGVKNE
jgi:hypothetical protein